MWICTQIKKCLPIVLLLGFIVSLLLFVILSPRLHASEKETWHGFYFTNHDLQPAYTSDNDFDNVTQCQDWAIHVRQTKSEASNEDQFACSKHCYKKTPTMWVCNQEGKFNGGFEGY